MSVATWSLRERAVCSLPPTGPDDLGQPPLDRHVDVLVVGLERERAAVELACDAVEPAQQLVAIGVGDDPAGREHRRVRARLLDVVRARAASRSRSTRSSRWKTGSWGSEKRDMAGIMRVNGARRARPPAADDAAAELLYVSAAPYYDAYAAASGGRGGCCAGLRPSRPHRRAASCAASPRLDGGVVGRAGRLPVRGGDRLARRFVALTCARLPPWRWPRLAAPPARAGDRRAAARRRDALLRRRARGRAGARRRGVAARAALPRPSGGARGRARGVALDTGLQNRGRAGAVRGLRLRASATCAAAPDERTARAVGGPGFVSYFKRLPSTARSASATRATWPSVICREERQRDRARGDVLGDRELAWRWPKRSR